MKYVELALKFVEHLQLNNLPSETKQFILLYIPMKIVISMYISILIKNIIVWYVRKWILLASFIFAFSSVHCGFINTLPIVYLCYLLKGKWNEYDLRNYIKSKGKNIFTNLWTIRFLEIHKLCVMKNSKRIFEMLNSIAILNFNEEEDYYIAISRVNW